MFRLNGGFPFLLSLAMFSHFPTSIAASFDCSKATTLVEKVICSDVQLSVKDDALMEAYKRALVDAKDANTLKAQQRSWLKEVRNQCPDVACLNRAYDRRIGDLGGHASMASNIPRPTDQSVVMGRCHMDSCWWWKVASMETLKTGPKGRLVKAAVRTTSEEFSSDEVEKDGYPGFPKSNAQWDEKPTEVYLFCSKTLPAVIEYDKDRKKYQVVIPFDNDGGPWGYTEGGANLYDHACNNGQSSTYAINPAYADAEILLQVPEDILTFK